MYEYLTTPTSRTARERGPFGELHYIAVSRTAAGSDQREAFLKERPSVWATLRRELDRLIADGTTQDVYDEMLEAFVISARQLWRQRVGEPSETLGEVLAQDEAAEGFEDVAEIDAMANPGNRGRLAKLFQRMSAARTQKRRGLAVIAREFSRSRSA